MNAKKGIKIAEGPKGAKRLSEGLQWAGGKQVGSRDKAGTGSSQDPPTSQGRQVFGFEGTASVCIQQNSLSNHIECGQGPLGKEDGLLWGPNEQHCERFLWHVFRVTQYAKVCQQHVAR